jgi:hypothetical protein
MIAMNNLRRIDDRRLNVENLKCLQMIWVDGLKGLASRQGQKNFGALMSFVIPLKKKTGCPNVAACCDEPGCQRRGCRGDTDGRKVGKVTEHMGRHQLTVLRFLLAAELLPLPLSQERGCSKRAEPPDHLVEDWRHSANAGSYSREVL